MDQPCAQAGVSVSNAGHSDRGEAFFRQIFDLTPCAMLVVSQDGSIDLVNREAERLFGYSRQELIGQDVEMLMPAQFRARHPQLRRAYADAPTVRGMGIDRALHGLCKDGRNVPVEIGLSPIEIDGHLRVVASVVDVSLRKKFERALIERTEQLVASNRDLEQFAYLASHDLQEPLRGVSGCVTLLKERYGGQIDDKADEYIDHAVRGADRMKQMIDNLLGYSRVGRSQENFRWFEGDQALDGAVANLGAAIAETGATIDRQPLPRLFGDPAQFQQLFQNLLGNSLKFRRSDAPPQIRISIGESGDDWHITVADNGIGIDPAYAERVFGIFRRLHTRRHYPGSGIGLAICKRIVEAHRGRIWAKTDVREGAELVVAVPRNVEGDASDAAGGEPL